MKRDCRFLFALLVVALLVCIATVTLVACDGDKNHGDTSNGGNGDTTPSDHVHTFDEKWSHDDEYHWHAATCGHDDQMEDRAQHELVWTTTTPASCEDDGVQTGACVCGYSETKSIDAIGHDYTPSWSWKSDHSGATLVFTCGNDATHKLQAEAQITQRDEIDGCGAYIIYTATATLLDETYTDTQKVDNGATHQYEFSKWEWQDDYSSAVAVFVCQRDDTHVYRSDTVTSQKTEEHQPTCTEDGNIKYTVSVDFEGQTYKDEKTQVLSKSGHTFEKWVNTQEPDCTTAGKKRQQCSVCGELYGDEETVVALGHDFNTAWSYDNDKHWHKCFRCDETDKHIEHTVEKWNDVKPADYDNDGEATGVCTECGNAIKKQLKKLVADELFDFEFHEATSNNDAYYEIKSYKGNLTDVLIPAKYNNVPVTYIGYRAFDIRTDLTSITIPNSVTRIGEYSFFDCASLTEINIPDSVNSIGEGAFQYCIGLKEITIPDSVNSISFGAFTYCDDLRTVTIGKGATNISLGAFSDCINLESIEVKEGNPIYKSDGNCIIEKSSNTLILGCKTSVIPNYVTNIGMEAFEGCTSLTDIIIPDSVTIIDRYAFLDCKGLQSVIISECLTSLGKETFRGCSSLESIEVKEGNPIYKSDGNCIIEKSSNTLILGCKTSVIPNYVTNIGDHAFYDCSGLKEILIPNSVTIIGDAAFENCTGLTSITIPNSVTNIGMSAFEGCAGLTEIIIPGSVKIIDAWAFRYCTDLQTVTISEGVSSIGFSAFSDCTSLKSITIPNSVTSIYESFTYCDNLESIEVRDGNPTYKSDGNCIIEKSSNTLILGCKTSVIPNYVTSIGESAFAGCRGLTEITIPDSVTSIGSGAFDQCSELIRITISDNVTFIGDGAFSLTAWFFTLPEGVVYINNVLYTYNGEMPENATIDIKEGTVSISPYAFARPTRNKLVSITIPDSVKSIGNSAFGGCENLRTVTIGKGVTNIDAYAFAGCTGLTSVTIPDSVTFIDAVAFADCTGLQTVTIGKGVTSIGHNAFKDCTCLQTVYYEGTSEQWNDILISYNYELNNAKRYYFSAEDPYEKGTAKEGEEYWHWNEDKTQPVVWAKQG